MDFPGQTGAGLPVELDTTTADVQLAQEGARRREMLHHWPAISVVRTGHERPECLKNTLT